MLGQSGGGKVVVPPIGGRSPSSLTTVSSSSVVGEVLGQIRRRVGLVVVCHDGTVARDDRR
ncbi:MAG TPA: hypothetical protein VGU26_01660 [Gaiellaceae bacterium]|nr:hypothetical protein [Gaiellaceae bacterium]